MKKSQSKHSLHSSSFSSASATAVSDATTTPFASRFLFGYVLSHSLCIGFGFV
ncbi:hypothetical protein ISN45_Aa07g003290 [Arabidopsis thaliana x Arabidopsis arenosa]|uniref:Uncharacterized protein n=1 Tax=Arabidopsis thaliana x Arabidopsis arenosa TaxID=1240361 RepID=A0A8T1Y468_9BRAS|nr:hypothetical protein ISN45_Aa07g003290 [Arabidopsis thaliana x Arabidopsis arenosa]